jgi:DnaK suppressor protein
MVIAQAGHAIRGELTLRGAYFATMIDTQQYKPRLLDLERSLAGRTDRDVEGGRAELVDTPQDAGDASVSDVAIDSAFTSAELSSVVLQQVRDALRRIDEGTFGRCIVDGGPIEAKRLEAVPWAPYCLKHQSLLEAAGRERTWTL